MAKTINRLSDRSVRGTLAPGMHHDGHGLYLQVRGTGARTWLYRFTLGKRVRDMGLGSLHDVSLAEARDARDAARRLVKSGLDPITQRKAHALTAGAARLADLAGEGRASPSAPARLSPSLLACWEAYVSAHEGVWRGDKTKAGWMRSIHNHAAAIKAVPIDEIGVAEVVAVLEPIWLTKAESAGKLRERLEKVFDFAKVKGHRHGDNPAAWKGNLIHLLPPRPKLQRGHMRAVAYAQVPDLMKALKRREGMAARALEFTILTIARQTMTLMATPAEIHGDLWSLEAERMKMRPFRQPLSSGALAVLNAVGADKRRPDDVIFRGPKGGAMSTAAMRKVLLQLEAEGFDGTPHGMRSSFRDWAGDETEYARETIEACLAHLVGDETERAYRRSDALKKRREVLEAWSSYCLSGERKSPAQSL